MPPIVLNLKYLVLEGFISINIKKNQAEGYSIISIDIPNQLSHYIGYSTNGRDIVTLFTKGSHLLFLIVMANKEDHRDKYCTLKQ